MTTKKKTATASAKRVLAKVAGPLTIGGTLNAIRLGEEESLERFAARLKVTRAHLCDIEKGRRGVAPERAASWARALGYSEAQFVRLALQAVLDEAGLDLTVDVRAAS